MRQFFPRTFAAFALCLCLAPSAEAGLIPWTFDALFGPPGSLQQWWAGYPNGNPYIGGYGGGGYGTMYGTGYRGWYGGGYAAPNYGYSNCCAPVTANYYSSSYGDCGCNPCGGCSSCSGGCASGTCASGDCGTGSNYSPEPTPDATPRTFKKDDGTDTSDDFRPLQPRESNDEILPNPGSGNFQSPRPAPGEPGGGGDDILPRGVLRPEAEGAYVKPIEVETTVAGSYQPQRHRIVMSAGYRLPTVARLEVTPKAKSDQTQIAANK